MPTFTLKQDHHYHREWWLFSFPHVGKKSVTKTVTFDASCAYELPVTDYDHQEDVNKLWGLSYGLLGVHRNSVRFGWRWSRSAQKIVLLAYVYNDGVKNWDAQLLYPVVAQVDLGVPITTSIDITPTEYIFTVKQGDVSCGPPVAVPHGKHATWGFYCYPYFGGDETAPHTMKIELD